MNNKTILLIVLVSLSGMFTQSGLNSPTQNVVSYNNLPGKLLIQKESEPIIDIVIHNQSKTNVFFLVAYMTHIEEFSINKVSQEVVLLSNKSFGLNLSASIWDIKQDLNQNFIVALSNGSIFSFTFDNKINWIQKFSNRDISNLDELQNGLFVAISDQGEIYWIQPNDGSIVNSFVLNNTYFTVSTSFGNYFVAGNNKGDIYVFNSFQNIFNASIGINQVISLAINENYLAAFSFDSLLRIFNTKTGDILFNSSYDKIGFDSLFLFNSTLYITQIDGQFSALDLSTKSTIWFQNSLFINQLLIGEFTGDSIPDLISLTNTGKLITLQQNGTLENTESISNSQITAVKPMSINNDTITDLVIGSRIGELYLFIGMDSTPPIIEPGTITYSETANSITISFQTNEPSISTISYREGKKSELSISNNTYLTNHTYIISNLKSNTNYTLQISVTDKAKNTNNSILLVIQTKQSPPPYALYTLFGGVLIFGLVGSTYYVTKRRSQKKAFLQGEKYYESGEYILAIRSYIKANNKDRILEIVTFLVSNPQLSTFVDEIKQMEELEEYMIDIQEIIQNKEI